MQKSLIEPEIFGFFQHKVERVPHFARVSEVRHMKMKEIGLKGRARVPRAPLSWIRQLFVFTILSGSTT